MNENVYKRGASVTTKSGEIHVIQGSSRNFSTGEVKYLTDKTNELAHDDIAGLTAETPAPAAPAAPAAAPAPAAPAAPAPAPAPTETPKAKGKAGKSTETSVPTDEEKYAALSALNRAELAQLIADKGLDIDTESGATDAELVASICELLNIAVI